MITHVDAIVMAKLDYTFLVTIVIDTERPCRVSVDTGGIRSPIGPGNIKTASENSLTKRGETFGLDFGTTDWGVKS